MPDLSDNALAFGGSNEFTGVSTSRTLMFKELTLLLDGTAPDATASDYRRAIVEDNLLMKPSASTRVKTFSYLRDRFGLDSAIPAFALLHFFWNRDVTGRPLMALQIAALRDPALRATLPAIIAVQPDRTITSADFGAAIDASVPEKLTEKTLKAIGERMTSSFKQTGHLRGRTNAVRERVKPTPGSVTIGLLFASLEGRGGVAMLDSEWVRILDGTHEQLLAEARLAAARGWLEFRQAGDVLEITFHQLKREIGASQ